MSCVNLGKKIFQQLVRCERGVAFMEFAISVLLLIFIFFGAVELARYVLVLQKLQYLVNKETNIISSIDPTTVGRSYTFNPVEMYGIAGTPTIDNLIQPYTFDKTGMLILTDIYLDPLGGPNGGGANPKATATVEWRYCSSAGLENDGTMGSISNTDTISGGSTTGAPMSNLPPGSSYSKTTGGVTTSYSINSKFGLLGGAAALTLLPTIEPNFATGGGVTGSEIIVAEIYYDYTTITDNTFTNALMSALNNKTIYLYAASVPRFGVMAGLLSSNPPMGSITATSYTNQYNPLPRTGSSVNSNCF